MMIGFNHRVIRGMSCLRMKSRFTKNVAEGERCRMGVEKGSMKNTAKMNGFNHKVFRGMSCLGVKKKTYGKYRVR